MRAAVYVRVSKGKGQDTASQLPDLRRWVEAAGAEATWYEDRMTGKTMDRPGFAEVLKAIGRREVDTLVVWRLDRLGRTAAGLVPLFEDLRRAGVNLVSLRDGLDLATPAGRLMAHVLASVAAYETEVRAERIQAGLEVAKANGKALGRPKGSGKGQRLKVTPEAEEMARRLKAEGRPVAAIARATGLHRSTIYTILGG